MPNQPAPNASGKCIGFVERVDARAREQRDARRSRPPSWIAKKFMVGVVIAILIYTYYVYVGRFCVDMIKRSSNAMGGRPQGSKRLYACRNRCRGLIRDDIFSRFPHNLQLFLPAYILGLPPNNNNTPRLC